MFLSWISNESSYCKEQHEIQITFLSFYSEVTAVFVCIICNHNRVYIMLVATGDKIVHFNVYSFDILWVKLKKIVSRV